MATISFLTRDLQNDYPRIGWLPNLPAGADSLWRQFAPQGWEQPEYPEVVLTQKGGQWQLFLSAIDSGRSDSPDGRGRVIRVSLYLTGSVAEGAALEGLVGHFLKEVIGGNGTALKELFRSKITNNSPTEWRDMGAAKQADVASDLLAALRALPPCLNPTGSPSAWYGGSKPNLAAFHGVCLDLLTGKREGIAISLANLMECEVAKAMTACRKYGNCVILLTCMGEDELPLKEFQLPAVKVGSTQPASRSNGGAGMNDPRRLAGLVALVVIALLTVFAWRGCGHNSPANLEKKTNDIKLEM